MSDFQRIDARLEMMENTLTKMEAAVSKGMDTISQAMAQVAVVMSKVQDNAEEHKVIHRRIDEVHTVSDNLDKRVTVLETPPPPDSPVTTGVKVCAAITALTAFLALILMHAKELEAIIFQR